MPITKFKTFEEARRALWLDSGDARIIERMRHLSEMARPRQRPRGVTRYRTIEEAKADR